MPPQINPGQDLAVLDQVAVMLRSPEWRRVDELEEKMKDLAPQEMPLRHVFTPGLYTREIFIPAGTLATTRIHLQEHPFVLLKGDVSVWTAEDGWVRFKAPFHGVTFAGTRRVLYTHEDTVWLTFHPTDKTDPDDVAREITYTGGKYEDLGIASAHRPALQ